MQILRHSQIAVTMDIYAQVTPASTRAALAKLGTAFEPESPAEHDPALLQDAAARDGQMPFPALEMGL
jgi:hypothetical protein